MTESAANANAEVKNVPGNVGQQMVDGSFYLGRFTGNDGVAKDWFAAAEDAKSADTQDAEGNITRGKRLALSFNEAAEYALNATDLGYNDWVVPTGNDGRPSNKDPDLLNVIFNNKSTIGGFNETGKDPSGWYWSSSSATDSMGCIQNFRDGRQMFETKRDVEKDPDAKYEGLSVRLVRSIAV